VQGSIVEGIARLPRQLLGSEGTGITPTEAAQSTKHTSDLLRRFKEMGLSMKQEYREPAVLDQQETDLRNARLVMDEFADKVAVASRKAEKMVSRLEELGLVLGDLGLSSIKLAKFEDEVGTRSVGVYTQSATASKSISTHARHVGMAAVRISRLSKAATAQVALALEPLHDNLALAPAATSALKEREAALVTQQAITADLDRRRKAISALDHTGGDMAKAKKLIGLKNEAASLDAAHTAAEAEYIKVRDRNAQELQRCKTTRAEHFEIMLDNLSRVMAAYEQRKLSIWGSVAEDTFGQPLPADLADFKSSPTP
jgi:sorting nexin-1/2